MGHKTRHFLALMKKNWIIWKRTLGASICELFCPVVLMAILVIARFLVSSTEVAPQSNLSKSVLMAPLLNVTGGNASDPFSNLTSTMNAYNMTYGQFAAFTQTDLIKNNPLSYFMPSQCAATRDYKASPIIAIAGPDSYVVSLTRDLNQFIILYKQASEIARQRMQADPKAKQMLEAMGISAGVDVNLVVKRYDSHQSIMDYLNGPTYQQNDENPGLCFGFSISESAQDDIDVKMIFSGEFQDPNTQSIPSQLNAAWSEFDIDVDFSSFNRYFKQGYGLMQNWVANTVLKIKSGNANSTIALTMVPFKSDKYVQDDFGMIMSGMLPFFMLLIYILPMYRLISAIVSEKESRARESMKMMGLTDFSYWLSWWVYYLIVVTIISALVILVLGFNVLKYSNKGLAFLFFWIYGLSLFGLAVFLQAFFSRARVAAISGTLVYFGTSFVDVAVQDPSVKAGQKSLASLLTTVAVSRGANNLGKFETNGVGIQSSNMGVMYENYAMSTCLVVMVISLFLFLIIGLYLDNVLPSAYGLRRPWYYFFQSSYWFGTRRQSLQRTRSPKIDAMKEPDEEEAFFEAKYMKRENFEPVSRDLLKQEGDNKILKITDLEKKFDNGFHAVRCLNMKMYNGQIFALLGHNGAGKTTTISMLTGLIESSKGSAEVFGVDIFNEMDNVRNFLGVCPQHDVLFDLLTPEEHLDIFCDFKGVTSQGKQAEIEKMLKDVDVYHHKDTVAENLSGGSKRKLSVAIALIGGSKLVLLDEPTSGMDLTARRKLWNMLKNYKNNRIIILTTHYMDEADILGDRIGIMTGGKLICLGSSLFLKNRFGVGYNLTMVKKTKDSIQANMEKYLKSNLGKEVKLLSEISGEITFQIPNALSYKFKEFFNKFDLDLDSLNIKSYGISVTTLEEVFLKVGHGDDTNDDLQAKQALKADQVMVVKDETHLLQNQEYSISDPENHVSSFISFFQHLQALFLKRFFIYRRNRKGLVVEVFIPVLLVLIGFAFSKVQFFVPQPQRHLTPDLYPLKQRILANQDLIVSASNASFNIQPMTLMKSLPQFSEAFDINYKSYPQYNISTINGTRQVATAFDNDIFTNRLNGSYFPYRYGSYFIYEANNQTKQFKADVFMNLTSQDVGVAYPQFLYEAILQEALGKPNLKFKVTTQPYPITEKLKLRAKTASGFFIAFVVSIGFALIPAMVVSFVLNEREKNLKHMQMISGMSLTAYWTSNLIFDICKAIIPSAIVIALIYIFDLNYSCTWLLFLLFPVGVIPFTYVMSFVFQSENVAQTITIFLHFVFAGIGAIVIFLLKIIESTRSVGDALSWVFKIIPSYCLTETILYDSAKSRLNVVRPDLKRDSDWDIDLIGGNVLVLCLHFVFWLLVLAIIEMGAFNWIKKIVNLLPKNNIPEKDIDQLNLDEDVLDEDMKVLNPSQEEKDKMKIRVSAFRKVYPGYIRDPILAVERTSFSLEYGECFALLGINGAGKSTTFKALTCEIQPTRGEITINGFDAQTQFGEARKHIGYCPQHDAIFELMTVEEHLEYYARIKGIPSRVRAALIEQQINDMNLTEHRKKPAGTLSGGNKRKLSVAMAIIGNPPIVLLDEPSAGMDPEARRFMWRIIARISQHRKKSAVILTTHSMEEAEALSTKMGIMVKGGVFRCFGSSQHIKSKFGTGYEIEAKVRKLTPEDINQMALRFNLKEINGSDLMKLDQLKDLMKEHNIENFLIDEIRLGGLGEDLIKEAQDNGDGRVSYHNFLTWLHVEQAGMTIINGLCEYFPTVEILEHYSDYYKVRVPRSDKSIGFVFGFVEGHREQFQISEYSVSQTTLEQIFSTFANLKLDDDSKKLIFRKNSLSARAELYEEKEENTLKRQFSKNKNGKGVTPQVVQQVKVNSRIQEP